MLDVLIIVSLLAGAYLGYQRGLVRQLVSLTGWLIAYIAAFMLSDELAAWLEKLPLFENSETVTTQSTVTATLIARPVEYVSRAVAFVLLFFGFKLALTGIGMVLHGIASLPVLRTVNRTGGVLLALVETIVIVVAVVLVLQQLPSVNVQTWVASSTIYQWIEANSPYLLDIFQSFLHKE